MRWHTTKSEKPRYESVDCFESLKSQLVQLGFDVHQAERVLSFFCVQKRNVNIENLFHWLQLLHTLNVGQSFETAARCPSILTHRAESASRNATAIVTWMSSIGLTDTEIPQIFRTCPMLITIPQATAEQVAAWLTSDLGWSSSMVVRLMRKRPSFFAFSSVDTLRPKLVFFSQHFSIQQISNALFIQPRLFDTTIAHNQSQVLSLQAIGLSQFQVAEMIRKMPGLLLRDIAGDVTQAKVRFLTQIIRQPVQEMLKFPAFLTLSLANRIGPRWAFHSLYSPDQPFNLNTRLSPTDINFTHRLQSPSLDAECVLTGMGRLQIFERFAAQWQEREGREWAVTNDTRFSKKASGQSQRKDSADAAAAAENEA